MKWRIVTIYKDFFNLLNHSFVDSILLQCFLNTDSKNVLQVNCIIGLEDKFVQFEEWRE